VDTGQYYVSNNLFLILPRQSCALDVWGLCAFLNSSFATWFFRTIEPRQGRLFAEVKIKHLSRIPLPEGVLKPGECLHLNSLGAERVALEQQAAVGGEDMVGEVVKRRVRLDLEVDLEVRRLIGLDGWDST